MKGNARDVTKKDEIEDKKSKKHTLFCLICKNMRKSVVYVEFFDFILCKPAIQVCRARQNSSKVKNGGTRRAHLILSGTSPHEDLTDHLKRTC